MIIAPSHSWSLSRSSLRTFVSRESTNPKPLRVTQFAMRSAIFRSPLSVLMKMSFWRAGGVMGGHGVFGANTCSFTRCLNTSSPSAITVLPERSLRCSASPTSLKFRSGFLHWRTPFAPLGPADTANPKSPAASRPASFPAPAQKLNEKRAAPQDHVRRHLEKI